MHRRRRRVRPQRGTGVGSLVVVLLLQPLELRQDAVGHAGAVLWVVLEAPQRERGHVLRLLLGVLAAEPGVHDPDELPAVPELRLGPVHQRHRRRRPARLVHGAPPRQQLQQHDAEAVDVALHREVPRGDVLGRRVAAGADDERRDVALVPRRPVPGEPEIRQLGPEILNDIYDRELWMVN